MYAAYSYEAERDDELTFPANSCLTVIDKDTGEQTWWLCEYTSEDSKEVKRGLVPKNFLSLYPSLTSRHSDFKHFELPIEMPNTGNEKNNNMFKDDQLNAVIQPPLMLSAAS